ncbi:LLM class flavin-dependent oxidoreductase [SAR202 cluster bacterium AD-802-F09_MRT_200m]|nr:LLM class flavin-dependent oxidoreductase [SAR202 cluster bacterium AD-802-F09_MRT_200m]|tara:strand:+ start:1990 stop:3123 length:1134 start_codon:yes stop_codon:yes gene_type:complete
MQIGMFYQIQVPKPWTPTSDFDRYWEMMDQVVLAEGLGFRSVWLADHQFRTEWSHSSAPDVTLGAISQRTSQIRLGIAVAVPPVEHPLHIAARTATLDILSNGRVDLGVGRSGYPYQMAAFGTDLANATGMVDEALEIIPRAWTEGEFSYQGEYFNIPPREVHPKPVQKPHPPIWLGCSQEETFRKAGELGLGCLAMSGGGPDRLTQLIQAYRSSIKAAKPVGKLIQNKVSISMLAICAESRQKAQERGAEILDWYRHQQSLRDVRVWQDQDPSNVPDDYQWHYQRSTGTDSHKGEYVSSLDQIKAGRYCIGNPDDCLGYLEQYFPTGVDEIMPLFQVGPMAHQEVMETLRLFGKHVIPQLTQPEQTTEAATTADGG